jgi:hypothetical protein
MTTDALALAVEWADRGVPALPVAIRWDSAKGKTNKVPLTARGFIDATVDHDRLAALFGATRRGRATSLAVGLHLGPAGFLAVDVDGRDNLAAWDQLDMPPTFTVDTPSGGRHFIYRKREAVHVGTTHALAGVDVIRSDDGWIVAPGTETQWGEWLSCDAWPDDVAEAPDELWSAIEHGASGGNGTSPTIRARDLRAVVAALRADGREQDIEAVQMLCASYGGHHPYLAGETVHVTRPNKKAGSSATVGRVGPGVVYMFATGWDPFTPRHRYVVAGDVLADEADDEPQPPTAQAATKRIETVRLADVHAEPVSWLWPGRLPLGKVVIVDGDPGLGKSTVLLDLAARVTTGAVMPDEVIGEREAGSVVLLSAEDGLGDTIRPRLDAAGADVTRVHAITAIATTDANGEVQRVPPMLPRDLALLASVIESTGAVLVVLDVLVAYLDPKLSTYNDADVRRVLSALAAVAERNACCIVALRHLRKGGGRSAVYAGGGSIGIIGASRVGLTVGFDPDDREVPDPNDRRRVLAVAKNNLARIAPALGFKIVEADESSRVEWLGEVTHRADDLVDHETDADDRADREAFLRELLADGPMPSTDVDKARAVGGWSMKQLRSALRRIGGHVERVGFGSQGHWQWSIDAPKGAIDPQSQERESMPSMGNLWGDGDEYEGDV